MLQMLIENVSSILEKIKHAALSAGRNPADITLVAVTKTVGPEKIKEAIDIGVAIFGENKVQEAQEKISDVKFEISNPIRHGRIEWHLIGHLQKNKAKSAVTLFDLIHTIDSIGLAEEVDRQAEKIHKIQRVL